MTVGEMVGIITGSCGTILSIINMARSWFKDRRRLKVECRVITETYLNSKNEVERTRRFLEYRVTNISQSPIIVMAIGGNTIFKKEKKIGRFAIKVDKTPKLLFGENIAQKIEPFPHMNTQKPISLWAIDSLEKHHKCSRGNFKKVLKQGFFEIEDKKD